MPDLQKIHVIVLATDPQTGRGGIADAMEGFFRAIRMAGLSYTFIATHSETAPGGRWKPWVKSFVGVYRAQRDSRRVGEKPIAFIHMGGGVISIIRKSLLATFLRILGVPVVIQLHGPEVEGYLRHSISRFLFRLSLAPANLIAALTPWWADHLASNGLSKQIHVLPNVAPKAAELEAKIPLAKKVIDTRCCVLTMSRMVRGKGFDAVVESIPSVTEPCVFLFAGSGYQEPELRWKVAMLKSDHVVQFCGWVENIQKPDVFAQADIFCLPSQYDSFGMVYVEAMSYGLPVIAVRRGPIVDVVGDGEAGILVPENDMQAIASAIDVLKKDPSLRSEFGNRGKKRVLSLYSADVIGKKVRLICEELSVRKSI